MADLSGRLLVPAHAIRKLTVDRTDPVKPGVAYSQSPHELLLAAGRLQRDGKTRDEIRKILGASFSLGVTNEIMDSFLNQAREYLRQAIAAGMEPEETVTHLTVDAGTIFVQPQTAARLPHVDGEPVIDLTELTPEDDLDD